MANALACFYARSGVCSTPYKYTVSETRACFDARNARVMLALTHVLTYLYVMPLTQSTRQRPAIILRPGRWQAICARLGLYSDTERARHFGIDRAAIVRTQRGEMAPGAVFVACVLTTLNCRFEDVFEVTVR